MVMVKWDFSGVVVVVGVGGGVGRYFLASLVLFLVLTRVRFCLFSFFFSCSLLVTSAPAETQNPVGFSPGRDAAGGDRLPRGEKNGATFDEGGGTKSQTGSKGALRGEHFTVFMGGFEVLRQNFCSCFFVLCFLCLPDQSCLISYPPLPETYN